MDLYEVHEEGAFNVIAVYKSNEYEIIGHFIALGSGQPCPDSDTTARYIMVDVCENNQEIGVRASWCKV